MMLRSCGLPPSIPAAELPQFEADAQAAFDRALAVIAGAKKWASAWNNAGNIDAGNCAAKMHAWMGVGANASLSLQIGGDVFNRAKAAPTPAQRAHENNTAAAFLVARGPSAMLGLDVQGCYEDMKEYDLAPVLNADFGTPLGAGAEGPAGVFKRKFTTGEVTLDCNSWTSSFYN